MLSRALAGIWAMARFTAGSMHTVTDAPAPAARSADIGPWPWWAEPKRHCTFAPDWHFLRADRTSETKLPGAL
jgi:hypothetical protein